MKACRKPWLTVICCLNSNFVRVSSLSLLSVRFDFCCDLHHVIIVLHPRWTFTFARTTLWFLVHTILRHTSGMIRTKRRQDMTIFLFSNSDTKSTLACYTSRRTKQDTIRYSDWATITIDAAMTSFSFWVLPEWAGLSYYVRIGTYAFCWTSTNSGWHSWHFGA